MRQRTRVEGCPDEGRAMSSKELRRLAQRLGHPPNQPLSDFYCGTRGLRNTLSQRPPSGGEGRLITLTRKLQKPSGRDQHDISQENSGCCDAWRGAAPRLWPTRFVSAGG